MPQTADTALDFTLTLKQISAQGYRELGDLMAQHLNEPVAATFQQLAQLQQQHLSQLNPANMPIVRTFRDSEIEDDLMAGVHYLMTPHHAVQLALATERNSHRLIRQHSGGAAPDWLPLLQAHEQSLQDLLATLPRPEAGWDDDPDPPHIDQ